MPELAKFIMQTRGGSIRKPSKRISIAEAAMLLDVAAEEKWHTHHKRRLGHTTSRQILSSLKALADMNAPKSYR